MNVKIVGINTYDAVDVNIDEIGGEDVSSGGSISVKMD